MQPEDQQSQRERFAGRGAATPPQHLARGEMTSAQDPTTCNHGPVDRSQPIGCGGELHLPLHKRVHLFTIDALFVRHTRHGERKR